MRNHSPPIVASFQRGSHDLGEQGGVTSTDSVVTAATAGQNFDQLFSAVLPLTAVDR